jgi:pilus assembly protein CpaE
MFRPLLMKADALMTSNPFELSTQHVGATGRPASVAQPSAPKTAVRSPIIGVLGAKGGVGATTCAINLAAALGRNQQKTTLIDANLQHPDASIVLGKNHNFSVMELIERSGQVDGNMLEACTTAVSDALPACRLLSPPLDGGAGVSTHLSELSECLGTMREHSSYWVIDLPKHLDRHLVTLMDRCDRIVLVFEATLPSLTAARRWIKVLQELDYPTERVVFTLNRTGGKVKLVEQQLESIAPFGELHRVPNAYELCEKSVARCEPALVTQPRAPYSVAMIKLADDLIRGLTNG